MSACVWIALRQRRKKSWSQRNKIENCLSAIRRVPRLRYIAATHLPHAAAKPKRIRSKFLHPGPGFGGYCLPKDSRASVHIAKGFRERIRTVEAAVHVNDAQHIPVVQKLRKNLEPLRGKTLAVLGLSFKPNTDDLRESKAIAICRSLLEDGCVLRVFDPAAMERAKQVLSSTGVTFCADPYQAADAADGLVVCTEWNEFRSLDLERIKGLMHGNVLLDAKNIFEPHRAADLGFHYYGIGRS